MRLLNIAIVLIFFVCGGVIGYGIAEETRASGETIYISINSPIATVTTELQDGYLIPDGKGSLKIVTKEEYNAYWED